MRMWLGSPGILTLVILSYLRTGVSATHPSSISSALSAVDDRISSALSELPSAVGDAERAAIRARRRKNAQNVWIGISIATGLVVKTAGLNLLRDNQISPGDIVDRIGRAVTSGSYSGDRFLRYKSLRFKCGVSDLLRVLGRYDMLLHLGELYGPYLAEGRRPPPEMEPKALKYHALQMAVDVSEALSCLLEEGDPAKDLGLRIQALSDLVLRRLERSEQAFDLVQRRRI